jgi:hypothetical protein
MENIKTEMDKVKQVKKENKQKKADAKKERENVLESTNN